MDVRIASGRIDHAYANGLGVPFFPFRKSFAASRSIQRTTRSVFVQTFRESEFRSQELQEFRVRRMDVRIAGGHRSCVRQRSGCRFSRSGRILLLPFDSTHCASVFVQTFGNQNPEFRSQELQEFRSRRMDVRIAGGRIDHACANGSGCRFSHSGRTLLLPVRFNALRVQNGRPNRGWAHRSCVRQRFGVPLFLFWKNFAASHSIQGATRSVLVQTYQQAFSPATPAF